MKSDLYGLLDKNSRLDRTFENPHPEVGTPRQVFSRYISMKGDRITTTEDTEEGKSAAVLLAYYEHLATGRSDTLENIVKGTGFSLEELKKGKIVFVTPRLIKKL